MKPVFLSFLCKDSWLMCVLSALGLPTDGKQRNFKMKHLLSPEPDVFIMLHNACFNAMTWVNEADQL